MASRKSLPDPWRSITLEELAKHNDVENGDAWLAVHGVVYDVASYAAKHPGGAGKIIKYAGKDASETFDMVHPYVNAASVLRGLQIGVLKGDPKAPKRNFCSKLKESLSNLGSNWSKAPTTYFKQDSIVATYVVEFVHASFEHDWTVGITEKKTLHVYKNNSAKKGWLSVCELPETLANDKLILTFKNNYKHAEITLRKPTPTSVWVQQLLVLSQKGKFVEVSESYAKFAGYIMTKKCLTPNIIMFGVQIVSSARINVPIGFHVELNCDEVEVTRSYTPVCPVLMDTITCSAKAQKKKQQEEMPVTILHFMIKIYPNGAFTKALDQIPLDDGRGIPTLKVSTPLGYFDTAFLRDFCVLYLIAAGSGLTPMTKIINRFWHLNEKMRSKKVLLLHFNQREHDLIWRKQFTELDDVTSWFHYFPALTQADSNVEWKGVRGRVSSDIISKCGAEVCSENIKGLKKACVCGPPGFNSSAVNALSGLVLSENIFVFSG